MDKICKRCEVKKDVSEFRVRNDNGHNGWVENICKACEREIGKERYWANINKPGAREKHNELAKKQHQKNRERNIAKMREKRKTPEYKAYMKAYRERNKKKIQSQEVITKKRYHEKNRDGLTDKYAAFQLRSQGAGKTEDLLENKNIIEVKKSQILIKRIKKIVSKIEVGESKVCTVCKEEKDLCNFYLLKKVRIDGGKRYSPFCRVCNTLNTRKKREKLKNKNNE